MERFSMEKRGRKSVALPDRAAIVQWLDQLAASSGDRRYRHAASILRAPPAGRPPCADDAAVIEVQWLFDTGRAGAIEVATRSCPRSRWAARCLAHDSDGVPLPPV